MPSSLTATKIKDTYKQVLHVDGGVTSTPKLVYDGDGTATALKVSTTGAVVETSSSTDALRITQTGTGNALVVEDSANPDSTPFVIDTNGKVLISSRTPIAALGGRTALIQYLSNDPTPPAQILSSFYSGTNYGSEIQFIASKSGTAGTFGGAVANGQGLGSLQFYGDDGTAGIPAAQIYAAVDGTPGTNDMPGRLVFSTTADGASSPTERMRITNAGQFGINGAPSSGNYQFQLGGTIISAGTASYGFVADTTIPSASTSSANLFYTSLKTQAAAFTLSTATHFSASQGTIGAGSAITSQYGFIANNTLTGATNNYGFYSNIASGTGRYNFFAAGSADNFFAGKFLVGTTSDTGMKVNIREDANADTGMQVINAASGTGAIAQFRVNNGTNNGWFGIGGTTYTGYAQIRANGLSMYTGSAAGIGFSADNAAGYITFGTGAGALERMRIDSAGRVGIGATPATSQKFTVVGSTLTDSTFYTVDAQTNVPATGTVGAYQFRSVFGTVASSFTLPTMVHFSTAQITIGSGSTVTSQYGFRVESSLTGATNNYGFYSNIASGTGRFNFYAAGSADNYFAGSVGIGTTNVGAWCGINLAPTLSGATTTYALFSPPTFTSSVTSIGIVYASVPTTQAASFTMSDLRHFNANQGTFGAGSVVTNQFGFFAQNSLAGATNNYGFYSAIASGTGRYNFYAAGSADNYFAGRLLIGTTSSTEPFKLYSATYAYGTFEGDSNAGLYVARNSTDASGPLYVTRKARGTTASKTIVANGDEVGATYYQAFDGSSYGNVAGIQAVVDGTPGVGDTPGRLVFYTSPDGTSSLTERMRIDSSGNVIHQAPTTAPTLSTNGTMVFNLTSNTNLRISVRGSDGVTRVANITLA